MNRFELTIRPCAALLASLPLVLLASPVFALQTDRQQPLEINADTTDGTLGDGRAELRGNVLIRQGSLVISADVAEVEKVEGRVREVVLTGEPVHLEQEIENQGQVQATANRIEYRVATGMVTLTGAADVQHPQYRVSGDVLNYDLNVQHFQGSGEEVNGRIRIELDPEVIDDSPPVEGEANGQLNEDSEPDPPTDTDSG